MKKYGNIQRWNHIKHFVTTHPYSEDNLDYLKNWLEHFIVPIKQSLEQDIENPMIGMLPNLKEET